MSDPQDPSSEGHERQVRQDSDELLDAVEKLRRTEAEKRRTPFSSEAFHRRAREVEYLARTVFRLATREQNHGERDVIETGPGGGVSGPDAGGADWPGGTMEDDAGEVDEPPRVNESHPGDD